MPDAIASNGPGTAEPPVLSIEQINSQFADEWVLVADPTMDERLEVLSGKVIAHHKDRDEFYRQAIALRPSYFAVLYTGTIPDEPVIIL